MQDWGERSERWAGIRTEWIDVQGTAVRTLRADAAEGAEDGTPLVLVHGLGGSATNWLEVMNGLSHHGPVLAMDLPGSGETEPPRPTSPRVTANARFVPALCRALGWDRVILVGNSMGGMISTIVASQQPDLVERVILVDPGLPAPVRSALQVPRMTLLLFAPFVIPGAGTKVLAARAKRLDVEELARQSRVLNFADPERCSEPMKELGVEHAIRGKELAWRLPAFTVAAESLMNLLVGAGRRRSLKAIDEVEAPTLLLWGDADRLVGQPVIDGLVARRPDWELHVFEGVGHVPQLEVPDDFLDIVAEFLTADVDATAAA